jgi:trehalose 6-phosphate synthase/phosphatase
MRLVIVSNRLPFEVTQVEGNIRVKQSTGGVATGIYSYIASQRKVSPDFSYLWVGWPGELPAGQMGEFQTQVSEAFLPVQLSDQHMEKFYDGFCNKTLWPLFHSFPMFTEYDDEFWHEYVQVNIIYCNKLAEVLKPGDVIFVNDYHLMLLPRLLRDIFPDNKICFFLHIPFPDFEIFRLLPGKWRADILSGLIASDMVGFHTYEYREYFLRCVRRILGIEHTLGEISALGRVCKAETIPMGIDFKLYSADTDDSLGKFPNYQVAQRRILSIDRLDYTKGILNRLRGFEAFLRKYPEMSQRVQLHVVAVPSRIGVELYQDLKNQVDEMIGNINGAFSRDNWIPIFYQYMGLPTREVIELYRRSDIALVTPLRDGMNLVAKEYLAARTDNTGVLILSEMAGAATELPGAIIINPNSVTEIADAIKQALDIPRAEQIDRNKPMREYLRVQNIDIWVSEIMESLNSGYVATGKVVDRHVGADTTKAMKLAYRVARSRVIFLDYDGTLSSFTLRPEDATPNEELYAILDALAADNSSQIYIISGRNRSFLSQHFQNTSLGLVAEHGAFVRLCGQDTWRPLVQVEADWFSRISPIMDKFRQRLYGTTVETKERSIVFHYRNAQGEENLVRERVLELYDTLLQLTSNIDVNVIRGNANVEVRGNGVNKGTAVMALLDMASHDFILCIGDDTTDEDMFRMLPWSAHTIKVGRQKTAARHYLADVSEVRAFLSALVQV